MRIIAESKPVAAIPFVHLGYVASSFLVPQLGLMLMGSILAVAGIGMASRFVKGKSRRGKKQIHVKLRKSWAGVIGIGFLLASAWLVVAAWMNGVPYYPYGDEAAYEVPPYDGGGNTSAKMHRVLEYIGMETSNTPSGPADEDTNPVRTLPTEAGVYDLASAVQNSQKRELAFEDGWYIPMKLKVVVTEGQETDYVLMSAGEDQTWDTKDDITSESYIEMQRAQQSQETAAPSTETIREDDDGDHAE
jgi:hypothetical protein